MSSERGMPSSSARESSWVIISSEMASLMVLRGITRRSGVEALVMMVTPSARRRSGSGMGDTSLHALRCAEHRLSHRRKDDILWTEPRCRLILTSSFRTELAGPPCSLLTLLQHDPEFVPFTLRRALNLGDLFGQLTPKRSCHVKGLAIATASRAVQDCRRCL